MKNVLFIGPYYQYDEWGKNAKGMIDILSEIEDINLSIRPVWLNNQFQIEVKEEEKYSKYENNILDHYDILIQNTLPQYFIKNQNFAKNILYSSLDCFVDSSGWASNIQFADSILVSSTLEQEIFSNVSTNNQKIVNIGASPYYKSEDKMKLELNFYQKKFLFVGGAEPKSGIYETIIAYLSGFNIYDNVILLIATSEDSEVMEQINSIKQKLGIYQDLRMYPNIAVISTNDARVINYLHVYCDFYIDISYNSKIGQNTLYSIFNDKIPILLDITKDFIGEDYPFLVKSAKEVCISDRRPFFEMYSGEYYWNMPNTCSLRTILQKAYNDSECAKNHLEKVKSSYTANITNKIKEAVCSQ